MIGGLGAAILTAVTVDFSVVDALTDYEPIPRLDEFTWEAKNGLLYRNGRPDYWIGNGSDLGATQATPLGLWLAWLQGTKLISVTHSSTAFQPQENDGGSVTIKGVLRESCYTWLREAIRLGFLTQAPEGFGKLHRWSNMHGVLAKHPELSECFYDSGHHQIADGASELGFKLLCTKREAIFRYGDRTGYFLPELNREPGPNPYNERVKLGFRVWARAKYGTIAEANRVWKTDFKSFDEVVLPHVAHGGLTADELRLPEAQCVAAEDKHRNARNALRSKTLREHPEWMYDWVLYVQADTLAITKKEFEWTRQIAPNSHPGIDTRAHQGNGDGYVSFDPEMIGCLEDIYYIHFVFTAYDQMNRPYVPEALADQICWPLFECKYFRSNTTKPIIDCENIVTRTIAAAPSAESMSANDIAAFDRADWQFEDVSTAERGEAYSFKVEFTVPRQCGKDFADGSRRFSICGTRNAKSCWFKLNGRNVPAWTFSSRFFKTDVSSLLKYGETNVLSGGMCLPEGELHRPRLFILPQDRLGALSPFTEKQYAAMFFSLMMNGQSSSIVWNWNPTDKLRPYEASLARKLSAVAEVALPAIRHRRGSVGFLYGYTAGMGLPSPREGRHCELMRWLGALEFSGRRPDVLGEGAFAERAREYPVIVAPRQALVKDATVAAAKAYVQAGGRLIVTPDSFAKTFTRYAASGFDRFAAAHRERVIVIEGAPTMEELMTRLEPHLPPPELDFAEAHPNGETPCIERLLVGDDRRKVLYLLNWGGLEHAVAVKLPAAMKDWRVTPVIGDIRHKGRMIGAKVAGSLGLAVAFVTAPGVEAPSMKVSPVRERIIARVNELNDISRHTPGVRRALFPKDMMESAGLLSADVLSGKEIYPYLLDRCRAFGYEVDELEPCKWTAEELAKHDLVFILQSNDATQWGKLTKEPKFIQMIQDYVERGGSLFLQSYTGYSSCANATAFSTIVPKLFGLSTHRMQMTHAQPADRAFGDPRQMVTDNVIADELTAGVKRVLLSAHSPMKVSKAKLAGRPLVATPPAADIADQSVMRVVERGKGRVFLNVEPMAFQPFRIEHADNAALLENVLGWLTRTPVTDAMRKDFKAKLFLTEADHKRIVADESGASAVASPTDDLVFRLWELQAHTNRELRTISIDFAKNGGNFRKLSASAQYSILSEGDTNFVRFAENGNAYAFGLAPLKNIPIKAGVGYKLSFDYRSPKNKAMVYLRFFDAAGRNITKGLSTSKGWTFTPYNQAWYDAGLSPAERWTTQTLAFTAPDGVAAVLPVLAKCVDSQGSHVDCRALSLMPGAFRVTRREVALTRTDRAASPVFESVAAALRLQPAFERMPGGCVRVKVAVSDLANPPRPRALEVGVEWKHDLVGWTWHDDWAHDEIIKKDSAPLGKVGSISGLKVGVYPFTAVSKDGVGMAIGTELDDPAFEAGTASPTSLLSVRALGLLPARPAAELKWLIMPFKGTWGFRSAARAYYASQGAKIPQIRTDAKEGTRCYLAVRATDLPASPDDFGLAYYIPSANRAQRLAARERGLLAHPYLLAWQIPTADYPVDAPIPPMSERLAELQSWLAITNERAFRNFGKCKRDLAQVVLNSMPWQADGTHPLSLENYGKIVHYWRLNVDPRIAAPNAATTFLGAVGKMAADSFDGVYLDNVYIQNFNNVRPDHLAVIAEPLVFDRDTAQPCAHAMQHQVAFVSELARRLHARNKRVTGNVFAGGAHRFNATIIDVFGCEVGPWGAESSAKRSAALRTLVSDGMACEQRFYACHRPVANLLQGGRIVKPIAPLTAEDIAAYVDRQLFYGFYPSVVTIGGEDAPGYANFKRYLGKSRQCERDRALFKAAIPVIRRLNRAGWEPETMLRTDVGAVRIERYGAPERGEALVTVRNNGDKPCTTRLMPEGDLVTATSLESIWHGTGEIAKREGAFEVSLPPLTTRAFVIK